jgi:hypothetical protein
MISVVLPGLELGDCLINRDQAVACSLVGFGIEKAGAGTFDSLVECQARWLHREADEARIFV